MWNLFFFNDVAILISSTHSAVPWYKPIINLTQLHLGLPHHWITITDKKTVLTSVYIYNTTIIIIIYWMKMTITSTITAKHLDLPAPVGPPFSFELKTV